MLVYFLLDNFSTVLDQTQTNDEGKYVFNLLPTGEYQLQFDIPAGFRATKLQGGLQVNSDIDDAGLVAMVPVLLGLEQCRCRCGLNQDSGKLEIGFGKTSMPMACRIMGEPLLNK